MPLRSCLGLLLAWAIEGDDHVELVQQNLGLGVTRDEPVPGVNPTSLVRGSNVTGVGLVFNGSNASDGSELDPVKTYKLKITGTWGATYQCMSELEFYDDLLQPLVATYKDQSSCYGCATACDKCTAAYGDPSVQFDSWPQPAQFDEVHSQETIVHPEKWSCSALGSFFEGKGEQVTTFQLKKRPSRYIFRRLAVGDFVAKDWTLEEQQSDGTWGVISVVSDATKAAVQTVDVQTQGIMIPPPIFPDVWGICWGGQPTEVVNLSTDESAQVLTSQYVPVKDVFLSNNGHGVQIDGRLGSIELDDGIYDASQFNFRFPSKVRMNDGQVSAGEMHILHKKRWKLGEPSKLAVVTVLLDLPLEGSDPTTDELFFRNLGLYDIPNESSPKLIDSYIDLNSLSRVLKSPYVKMNCTDTLHWLMVSEPAFVSGYIVKEFQDTFCSTCDFEPTVEIEEPTVVNPPNDGDEYRWWENRPLPVEAQQIAQKGGGEFESFGDHIAADASEVG